ncbi:geranylgeranyl reductase family protein [Calderihabitans maritimus]|uniref:Geranylgeranyl reductase n=1 Tax=Calderihabitans maritimus TaxID=1246530 RepID=A0A1Z5HSY0_9FIRM|nr:geranylgeranyl reductase family protein [Calderihabitans maritimus]GAW92642.1 geranylgeranyl reductase [Calderihabitans maritimus]
MHQVLVIGAGPAGAFLSYLLAKEGLDVVLLEKAKMPRPKPCGGAISLRAKNLIGFDLGELIEDEINHLVLTHNFVDPLEVRLDSPLAYLVDRKRFDFFLVKQAFEAGAQVYDEQKVLRIEILPDRVRVFTDRGSFDGQIVVGADGANSIVARTLGFNIKYGRALALDCSVSLPPEQMLRYKGTAYIDYGILAMGYSWIFPKATHLTAGIGSFLPRKDKKLKLELKNWLETYGLGNDGNRLEVKGHIVPTGLHTTTYHQERAILVGDAAGLTDPFTGEGIYNALLSSKLAAQVILDCTRKNKSIDLQPYSQLIKKNIIPELRAAARLALLFYPFSGTVHNLFCKKPELVKSLLQSVYAGYDTTGVLRQYSKLIVNFINSS